MVISSIGIIISTSSNEAELTEDGGAGRGKCPCLSMHSVTYINEAQTVRSTSDIKWITHPLEAAEPGGQGHYSLF